MIEFRVPEIRIGRVRPLGPNGVPSGIHKEPVKGPIMVLATGLESDEQGDRRHHGGPDKAIHAYAAANYRPWAAELPDIAPLLGPGAFGENLVVDDATEADICIGDQWRLGGALLEVSQARQPCWRLNLRFGRPDMAKRVQNSGRTGWYFRVIETGQIRASARAQLEARPHPQWDLQRVHHLLYQDCLDQPALREFATLPELPEKWRNLAQARLSTGMVEGWSRRLKTPE